MGIRELWSQGVGSEEGGDGSARGVCGFGGGEGKGKRAKEACCAAGSTYGCVVVGSVQAMEVAGLDFVSMNGGSVAVWVVMLFVCYETDLPSL